MDYLPWLNYLRNLMIFFCVHLRKSASHEIIYWTQIHPVRCLLSNRVNADCKDIKIDGPVKSPFCPVFVIPAKAGIQAFQAVLSA
jgi:hypothetical protein